MIGESGSPVDVSLGPAAEVPGLGTVCRLEPSAGVANGSAVVNDRGELLGLAMVLQTATGTTAAYAAPSSRLLAMPRIGPLPLLEWALRARGERAADGALAMTRGAAAALAGSLDEAAGHFESALTSTPGDADAWCALGSCRRLQRDASASIAVWTRAVTAQPSNPLLHHELALELTDAGRHEDAVAAFAEVVRLRPNDAEAHFNLGVALSQVRRYDEEYREYQRAVALDPRHVRALRNLGLSCLALNRNTEAVSSFSRASQLAPADPEVEAGLGLSYLSLRRYREAIDVLRHALQLAPGLVKARYSLGVAYFASGDRAAARSECQTLRSVDRQRAEQLCRMVDGK